MALGRTVRGLPRYYMDVGWWRSRRWAGATLAEVGLFSAMVGYCTEHGTDGRLPGDVNALAAVLGLRAGEVRKALRQVEARGTVERDAGDLVVVGWADHNPTAAEVEEHYAGKSSSGSLGNHVRWHVKQGKTDPACPHCTSDPVRDPTSDRTCDPEPVADRSHGMGWDRSTTPQPPAERGAKTRSSRADGTNPRARAVVDELAQQRAAFAEAEARTAAARERGAFEPVPRDVLADARQQLPGRRERPA